MQSSRGVMQASAAADGGAVVAAQVNFAFEMQKWHVLPGA